MFEWAELPGFGRHWRDAYDVFESRRSKGIYFLNIVSFSARLTTSAATCPIHPIQVFYAALTLEHAHPSHPDSDKKTMSPEQLWALDIRVAAIWLRDAGRALLEISAEDLGYWKAPLEEETELWAGGGLTRERWRFWGERLRGLCEEGWVDGETRVVALEAAGFIRDILGEGVEVSFLKSGPQKNELPGQEL